jgi:hypothetical protein
MRERLMIFFASLIIEANMQMRAAELKRADLRAVAMRERRRAALKIPG